MRLSSGTSALRSIIPCCISTAQRTASTGLENSTNSPSPVVLAIRPRRLVMPGSISSPRPGGAPKPDQQPPAGGLATPAAVPCDAGIDQLAPPRLELSEGSFLVGP